MQWSHLFWNFKRNVFIVNYKHSSSSFVVLSAHILSIVFVDYSEVRSSSITVTTVKAKVLLFDQLTRCSVFCLTVLVFCLTRLRGGTVRTLPRYCHVPGGLLHHLHDCAVGLCHLHQWSLGCRGSLLYPLYLCFITWHLYVTVSISNVVVSGDTICISMQGCNSYIFCYIVILLARWYIAI